MPRAWWRKWVWVPRRERWYFHVPVSVAYLDLLIQRDYVDHLRDELTRPSIFFIGLTDDPL